MAGKVSVLGLILSFPPYLRSAKARFPLNKATKVVVTHNAYKVYYQYTDSEYFSLKFVNIIVSVHFYHRFYHEAACNE